MWDRQGVESYEAHNPHAMSNCHTAPAPITRLTKRVGLFIIMRGGSGVLSDRPMGGLTAGGGEERGSILLCSMHDPCGVQNLQLMAGRSVMPSPPEKLVPRTDGDERPERARVSKRLKSKSKGTRIKPTKGAQPENLVPGRSRITRAGVDLQPTLGFDTTACDCGEENIGR